MFDPSTEITANNSAPDLQPFNNISQIVSELSKMELKSKITAIMELIKTADLDTLKGVFAQLSSFLHEFNSLTEVWHVPDSRMDGKPMKSALHVAAAHREYEVVEYLVNSMGFAKVLREEDICWRKNGLVGDIIRDIHTIDDNGFENKLKILGFLFNIRPDIIEAKAKDGVDSLPHFSPLYIAVKRVFTNGKQMEFMKFLLLHKANPNPELTVFQDMSPLHHLASVHAPPQPNLMEMVRLLIENGADPDAAERQGYTFAHQVALNFSSTPELFDEVVQYLVSIGRTNSLLARNRRGFRPLEVARSFGMQPLQSTLQVFVDLGLIPNINSNSVAFW